MARLGVGTLGTLIVGICIWTAGCAATPPPQPAKPAATVSVVEPQEQDEATDESEPAPEKVAPRDQCDDTYDEELERCAQVEDCDHDNPQCDQRLVDDHKNACLAMAKNSRDVCKCTQPDADETACEQLSSDDVEM